MHKGAALYWRIRIALLLTTMVTLCVELLLTRLVSILFQASDAYWVVAVALLGFGIGGALVAAGGAWLSERTGALLPWLLWSMTLSVLAPLVVFRHLHFSIGELSGATAIMGLLTVSFFCVLPFVLASAFISLVFMRNREAIGAFYFFDLLGAGLGCLVFVFTMDALGLALTLVLGAAILLAASLLLLDRLSAPRGAAILLVLAAIVSCAAFTSGPSPLVPFAPRELRLAYEYQGDRAKLDYQRWDPVARIDIVSIEGDRLEIPNDNRYKLLTQDGGAPSILLGFDRPFEELLFPERCLLGIAYWTKKNPSVLIVGPGGGPDVAAALRYKPRKVTAVEINQTTIDVVETHFKDFVGRLYQRPEVVVHHDDGRHFVHATDERFDVIQMTGVDTSVLGAAGSLQNLSENFLYTLDAFGEYFDHLTDDGYLSLSYPHHMRWAMPTLVMHLKLLSDRGVKEPGKHLLVSRSGGYVNVLLKKSPLTREEVATIAAHFEQPMVGLLLPLYYRLWGKKLPRNALSDWINEDAFAVQGLLYEPFSGHESPYDHIVRVWQHDPDAPAFWSSLESFRMATDDRPFFFLPIEVGWTFGGRLLWLLIPVFIFILGPLAVWRGRGLRVPGAWGPITYFACLGLAFIAIEMLLLQKLVLYLGHPTYAFAVVLGVLLVMAGVGSLISGRLARTPVGCVYVGVCGIAVCALAVSLLLGPLDAATAGFGLGVRALIAGLAVAPLGVFMGTLFPSGIRLLDQRSESFVPWAWGINGSASVIGSAGALFLAIQVGFTNLLLASLAVYLLAALTASRISGAKGQSTAQS